MPEYISVETYKELNNLFMPKEGTIAFCEEDSKMYTYSNGSWDTVKPNTEGGLKMSLYDINKQVISQLPPLTEEQIQQKIKDITYWRPSNLCLLYGQEINYFTIFRQKEGDSSYSKFGEAIIDCLKDIADEIYSMEVVEETNAYEIWFKYQDIVTVAYLFDATRCVVTFEE